MTYIEILELIESAAKKEPVIGTILRTDVYQLNTIPAIDYTAFCSQVKSITQDEYSRRYTMRLYYVDRQPEHPEEVQSAALEVLTNIISRLREDVDIMDGIQFDLFSQSFTDIVAGAYATVTIEVPLIPCIDDIP